MVGWLFALLSYHSWVLFSSLTVTYVLYLNTRRGFDAPSRRVVGVGDSASVWNEGFTFNDLALLNPFYNDAYRSQL